MMAADWFTVLNFKDINQTDFLLFTDKQDMKSPKPFIVIHKYATICIYKLLSIKIFNSDTLSAKSPRSGPDRVKTRAAKHHSANVPPARKIAIEIPLAAPI